MGVLAGRFVLTLVPIAVAYHLAHYLSFLLLAGQFIIPLASDPFGFGWDLFGTTLYRINIGIVDAHFVWFMAVVAIVTGHIVATWLAHETALTVFEPSTAARRSQGPMLVLMVGYTVLSLWILSQPIVEPWLHLRMAVSPFAMHRGEESRPADVKLRLIAHDSIPPLSGV